MGFHSPNLLEDGYDVRTIQELLGHKDVATTMICTHVLNRVGKGVRSPADALRNRVDSVFYGSAQREAESGIRQFFDNQRLDRT